MLDDSENEDPEAAGNIMSSKKGLGVFLLIVVGFTFSVLASTTGVSTVSVFGGLGTPENIGNILCNKNAYPFTARAALVGLGYQRPLGTLNKTVSIKAELQLLQHFTIQTCQEVTLATLVRVDNLLSTKTLPLHVSIGNGVSALVGPTPHLEKTRGRVRRVLNFFFLDMATDCWGKEVFFRWHHRCHLFKTIAHAGTGSNFFLLGMRSRF